MNDCQLMVGGGKLVVFLKKGQKDVPGACENTIPCWLHFLGLLGL